MNEQLLTLRQAAAASGLSIDRLRTGVHAGDLEYVRLTERGRIYLTLSAIQAWIGRQTRLPRRLPLPVGEALAPTIDDLLPAKRRFS